MTGLSTRPWGALGLGAGLAIAAPCRAQSPSMVTASLDATLGWARTAFPDAALSQVSGTAVVVAAGLEVETKHGYVASVSVPWGWAALEQPAGALLSSSGWGNPAVGARKTWRTQLATGAWGGALGVDFGVPLAASHPGEALADGRRLALSDAVSGFQAHAEFVPGVVPVGIEGELQREWSVWSVTGRANVTDLVAWDADSYLARVAAHRHTPYSTVAVELGARPAPALELSLRGLSVVNFTSVWGHDAGVHLATALTGRWSLGEGLGLEGEFFAPVFTQLGGQAVAGSLGLRYAH